MGVDEMELGTLERMYAEKRRYLEILELCQSNEIDKAIVKLENYIADIESAINNK